MDKATIERGNKRPALVAAAARIFAEKGYASTRVADIAARAGVGKGTVYEYFASKEELLFAVFESINEDITTRIHEVLDGEGAARERLARVLNLAAEVIAEQVDLQPVVIDFWAASRGGGFESHYREAVLASYARYRRLIADFVRDGQASGEFRTDIDAESVAATVVAAADGLGMQLYFDRTIDPRRITAAFGDLLYESLTLEGT